MCDKKNKNKIILLFIIMMCIVLSSCKNGFISFNDLDDNYIENNKKSIDNEEIKNENDDNEEYEDDDNYEYNEELENDKNIKNNDNIKSDYKIKKLFYVKRNSVYVMFDGKEYEICNVGKDAHLDNLDVYYVERDDIYYVIFRYFKDNIKIVYSVKNDNGNVKVNLLLEGSYEDYLKLEFLYKDEDKLYFSKFDINKNNNKEDVTGSIVEIQNGKVNYLYKNIKINNKKDDKLYYSKNIDTVFYLSKNENRTSFTIHSIKNGIDKIVYDDAHIRITDSLRVIATVDGLYYNLLNDEGIGGIAFYDGNEHVLTQDVYIREIKKTTSNNMFYIIANVHTKINLNDYIDSSSYPNSVLKELDNVDISKMNMITRNLYAVRKNDIKLIGENINVKYDHFIRMQDDYIFFYTLKNKFKNKNEKIRYVEFKDSIKDNKWAMNIDFVGQIGSYFNNYICDKNEYAFIYKGFEGTRLNFEDDETPKGNGSFLVDNDKLYLITTGTGEFYVGNIFFNEVSNLKRVSNEENFYKLSKASNKIFIDKQYSLHDGYGSATYDWYMYDNNKFTEISVDKNSNLRLCDDLDNDIYILNSKKGVYLYDEKNNKLDLIISNNEGKIKILYQIKKIGNKNIEYIYDKNKKENFYLENPNEYIKLLKENKINNDKLLENQNNDKDLEENKNIDVDNDNIIKVKEYKSLSDDYIKGSKNYKVDKEKNKSYDDIIFYHTWNKEGSYYEFYANLNKDGVVDKIHITDFKKDELDLDEPRYIFYDELKDLYYYCLVKKIKDDYENLEYNVYEMSINNNNTIKSKLKTKKVLSEKENEVIDYLSQRCGLIYLGKLGKNDIYITGARNIYADDGKDFKLIGNINELELKDLDKIIAINSYEEKLYYINYKTLYEVDNKLNKKTISENVKRFVSLQDELLYTTNFMYRYHDGKSERLFETNNDIEFIGHHNSDKVYILKENYKKVDERFTIDPSVATTEMQDAWEQVKNKRLYYSYGCNSLLIYKNGEFVKLVDQCKLIKDYDNRYIESIIDNPLLVATYESEEKVSFNEFYNNLSSEKKNDLLDEMSKYKHDLYIVYVNEYDLTLANANEIFKNKNSYTILEYVKNLKVEDKKISFTYDTEKYYIDLNNNYMENGSNSINDGSDESDKKDVKNIKNKLSKNDEELSIIKMGYYLR